MKERDAWILIDKNGHECGRGEGNPGRPLPGERVIWCDDMAAVESHPVAVATRRREAAQSAIDGASRVNRTQALALKTICARAYLRDVEEVVGAEFDPDCIDASLYPELYDEYWTTFDQHAWTPHELARRIVDKAGAASLAEANLRREKIIAERIAAEPLTAADPKEIQKHS